MAEKFPRSEEDRVRVENYSFYEDIFLGKHSAAFAKFSAEMSKKEKSMIYLICNFGALISKVSADLLFGEQINFKFPEKTDQKIIDAVDQIVNDNKLHTRNYESALANSYNGDSGIKLRRDAKGNPIIEYISPAIIFPEFEEDNINVTKKIELCWTKKVNGNTYLRKEIHTIGAIDNEVWLMATDGTLKYQVDFSEVYGMNHTIKEHEDTGIDDLLVKLIPNWKPTGFAFGISDYADLGTLFDEINNRMTRMADILNRHSDPKLAVPKGVLDEDGKVRTASFDLFEVSANTGGGINKPEYITWDASLESAFKEIDKIIEFLFLFSETSPSVFGLDKGGQAESGRALKFKLIRTLAKISRKKNYYDEALTWAIVTAQKLKGISKPVEPQIIWQDGIPQDTYEAAQIEEIRLRAGNTSLESSIRRLDGGSDADITAELDKIEKESSAKMDKAIGEIGKNSPNIDLMNKDDNMPDDMQTNGKQKQKMMNK
jgi:hypothetical protein